MQIPSDTHQGPPCPFRAVGKTGDAGNYPYNRQALPIIAEHNGVPIERLSKGMRYASNRYMQVWMAQLGALKLKGLAYRMNSGALMGRKQSLDALYDDFAEKFHNTLVGLDD